MSTLVTVGPALTRHKQDNPPADSSLGYFHTHTERTFDYWGQGRVRSGSRHGSPVFSFFNAKNTRQGAQKKKKKHEKIIIINLSQLSLKINKNISCPRSVIFIHILFLPTMRHFFCVFVCVCFLRYYYHYHYFLSFIIIIIINNNFYFIFPPLNEHWTKNEGEAHATKAGSMVHTADGATRGSVVWTFNRACRANVGYPRRRRGTRDDWTNVTTESLFLKAVGFSVWANIQTYRHEYVHVNIYVGSYAKKIVITREVGTKLHYPTFQQCVGCSKMVGENT